MHVRIYNGKTKHKKKRSLELNSKLDCLSISDIDAESCAMAVPHFVGQIILFPSRKDAPQPGIINHRPELFQLLMVNC